MYKRQFRPHPGQLVAVAEKITKVWVTKNVEKATEVRLRHTIPRSDQSIALRTTVQQNARQGLCTKEQAAYQRASGHILL